MPHDDPDRLARLETAIFGDGAANPGVLSQLGQLKLELAHTNRTLESINAHIAKGIWILLTAVIVALISLVMRPTSAAPGSNASINVGAATETVVDSARDYLTVSEVALREGKAERTIIEWIETGRIDPAPTKPSKEWIIAAKYRITPQLAAQSGTPP